MDAGGVFLAGVGSYADELGDNAFGFTGRAVGDLMPSGALFPKDGGLEVLGEFGSRNFEQVGCGAWCLGYVADSPDAAVGFVSVWVSGR